MLARHGVQLPNEFALLFKTVAFFAQYFQILDCDVLARQLTIMAGAFVYSSREVGVDAAAVLSPEVRAKMGEILRAEMRSAARSRAAKLYSSAPVMAAVAMVTAVAATSARYLAAGLEDGSAPFYAATAQAAMGVANSTGVLVQLEAAAETCLS